MRSSILRTVLGYAGIALNGAALSVLFAYALTAAKLGFFLLFVLSLIALILAALGSFLVVVPAIGRWMSGKAESLIDLGALRTQLDGFLAKKNA